MISWQSFVNDDNQKIDNGFQMFNTCSLGCYIKLLRNRVFIEQSIAIPQRIHFTKMPDGFKWLDVIYDQKFFMVSPGCILGLIFRQ